MTADSKASPANKDVIPLARVIEEVQAALSSYQNSLGSGSGALPSLQSAEFDFRVATTVSEGGKAEFLILKIGGSHENESVSEVTFTYTVPRPARAISAGEPNLTNALVAAIQSAATAVQAATGPGGMALSRFAVTIQYGVKWEGGPELKIAFVTLQATGDRNTTQSVKLVFGT